MSSPAACSVGHVGVVPGGGPELDGDVVVGAGEEGDDVFGRHRGRGRGGGRGRGSLHVPARGLRPRRVVGAVEVDVVDVDLGQVTRNQDLREVLAGGKLVEVGERHVHAHPAARHQRRGQDGDFVLDVVDQLDRDDPLQRTPDRFEEPDRLTRLAAAVDAVGSVVDQLQPELGRRRHLPEQREDDSRRDRSHEQERPPASPATLRLVRYEADERVGDRIEGPRQTAEQAHGPEVHAQREGQHDHHVADPLRQQVVHEPADPVADLVRE